MCLFPYRHLCVIIMLRPSAYPNADLNGLSVFEAKVQWGGDALVCFLFCKLTLLFYPSVQETQRVVDGPDTSYCIG